jgi:4-diphosphocytidyl-2-C-methyl-D-erythritol kinase
VPCAGRRALSLTLKGPSSTLAPGGNAVEAKACGQAKVNLTLEVGPRDAQGWHPVVTYLQRLAWDDQVRIRPLTRAGMELRVQGREAPRGRRNLAVRAAVAWRKVAGALPPGLSLELRKRIPWGTGLGGGSADAAATLRALSTLWPAPSLQIALEVAQGLGSDVPFAWSGLPAAVGRGRGEVLEAAPFLPQGWTLVVVVPSVRLSTAQVYARYDEGLPLPQGSLGRRTQEAASVLATGDASEGTLRQLGELVGSDLWPAAVRLEPSLKDVAQRLRAAAGPGRPVAMTGSGSALFAILPDPGEAMAVARQVRGRGTRAYVVHPVRDTERDGER